LVHSSGGTKNAILQNLEFIADRETKKTNKQKRISLHFKNNNT
jgi:hypothetical protein